MSVKTLLDVEFEKSYGAYIIYDDISSFGDLKINDMFIMEGLTSGIPVYKLYMKVYYRRVFNTIAFNGDRWTFQTYSVFGEQKVYRLKPNYLLRKLEMAFLRNEIKDYKTWMDLDRLVSFRFFSV